MIAKHALPLMVFFCCMTQWCHAGTLDPADALRGCAAEKVDARRLRCYDQAVSRPAASVSDEFGLEERQKPKEDTTPRKITARVIEVQTRTDGMLVLSLDNQQVWLQQEAVGYFPINIGDGVTIEHGSFGSFFISGSGTGHRTIRARRMK